MIAVSSIKPTKPLQDMATLQCRLLKSLVCQNSQQPRAACRTQHWHPHYQDLALCWIHSWASWSDELLVRSWQMIPERNWQINPNKKWRIDFELSLHKMFFCAFVCLNFKRKKKQLDFGGLQTSQQKNSCVFLEDKLYLNPSDFSIFSKIRMFSVLSVLWR